MNNNELLGFIPVYDDEDFLKTRYNPLTGKTESGNETIVINNSQEEPILQYRKINDSGVISWERIDGSDSPIRPARLSDLDYFLRETDWNIGLGRKVTKQFQDEESPRLYLFSDEKCSSEILNFEEDKLQSNYSVISDSYVESYDNVITAVISNFNSYYETLMNIKPMNYIHNQSNDSSINLGSIYYYNLISSRNLENGSTIVDLLSLNDSNYTNILNLNDLVPHTPNDELAKCTCLLTIGVDYSIDGRIYSKETSLTPFTVDNKGNLTSTDSLIIISDKVTLDYHDLCLRAFPTSVDVNECIISYCYITYDKQ